MSGLIYIPVPPEPVAVNEVIDAALARFVDDEAMMVHWSTPPDFDAWCAGNGAVSFRRRRWLRSAALFDRMLTMTACRTGAKFRRRALR